MGTYSGTITFNSVTLYITDMTPIKKQMTRKSVIGKTLVETKIIGIDDTQWELEVRGRITAATAGALSTARAAIEALDAIEPYAFVDGMHDGDYYMKPETLTFRDTGNAGNMSYEYTFTLVED
jgi:hypothetical protein